MHIKRLWPLVALVAISAVGCGGVPVTSPTGATCSGDPAGGTFKAGENLGGYWGMTLPATFKGLSSEAQVDAAITRASQTNDWTCFQSFYGGAVKKWRENTGR